MLPGTRVDAGRPSLLAHRSVAVVHEWFAATGGSENVFLAIADLVPHARRYVLWAEPDVEADSLKLRQSWLARSSDAPCESPAARPEIFRTGRVIAKLRARTALSTLSTASTALSVMWSTLSSWPFTRSTVPPTLLITGRSSLSAPLMNAETRPSVPPSWRNAYASARPTTTRKTLRAAYATSLQAKASGNTPRSYAAEAIAPAPTTASPS